MRIVKLSDLSEEDKKRIQERQIQNLRINGQNRIEANKKFNELINQKGEFDTSRHTSTVGKLQKAYKNNETVNKSLNDYYKNNTTSLWKGTQNFSDVTGKIGENTYKGAENGILSAIQNLGRNMFNLQGRKEEENIFDKVNKQILDNRKDLSSEEKTNIIDKMNNFSFSQKNLIKGIEEKNQKFQEKKNENTLKIQQNADSISNPVGKYLAGEIAPGIGQMLPGMLPGIGTTYFISSATGNYHDDAIQRGMTEDQATIYSGTMGIIEGALESLGANLTKNVGKQLLKKNIKGALVNYGLDIGENFLEESIVEPISEIAAQVYGGKDKTDWSNVGQRMIESGVAGALTSAITGGVSGIIGGIGSKANQQNQYVDYNTNKKLSKDSQNWMRQAENIIQENSNQKLLPQLVQNQQNANAQQIAPTVQNNAQNGISEQNNSILNNKNVPMLNYQYEKSDNAKINNLRQDAGKYFNNSEQARNYVNLLEQIITDKNVDIRLNDNLKTPDGKMANGSYSDGVITINPNSTKSGEFIAVHELTHAIGTDSMRNIIETYRKSNTEFNTAMENLLQNYNSTELTDEALSDVSAQLFGNQEFIANVSQSNPNIFKRIYNEIKYLWHQFRGYKNQNQFIDDLYYKWTQAYNSNSKLNEASNYSIAGKEGMTNAIKADTRNLALERNYNKAQQMQKSGIDNETIRQNTGWFQDRNGDWKFEFSDKDMSLKNIKLEKDKTYKLGDILEHDTLFDIYPELANYNVKFTDLNKPNGVYNIFDKDIKINNNQLNKKQYKSSIEGTLIHEIQHAIQDIENFEGGKSSKGSKLAYYESLGEIEASDTKARFLQEKHNNIDLADIAPESSKLNPKHKNLDRYLNNRKLLDKAKDGVYNYIKKRNGGSYEFSKENISKNKKQNMGLVDGRKRGRYVDEYEIENITNIGKNNEKNISENNKEDRGVYRDRVNKKIQESENNSGSFSFDKNARRYEDLEIANTVKFNKKADGTINIEISDNNELINQFTVFSKESASKQLGNNIADYIYNNATEDSKVINLKQKENVEFQDTSNKAKQLEIIKKTNPMLDDYHVGIRNIDDIKTFDEVINDEESFAWGDFTKKDAERALKKGKITIYSSYPIEQGTFVSTSKIQAEQYAGGKGRKMYSKTVSLEEVAWINGDEGQYANINQKYSLETDKWNNYLDDNFKSEGTKTNLKDIKNIAPIAKNVKNNNAIKKAPVNTSNMQGQQEKVKAPISGDVKARKHYKSIMESQYTSNEAKAISKELMGTDTYVPDSNNSQLERANERILNSTPESELNSFMSKVMNGEKITATDIAVGEKLIQYYSKTGDKGKLQDVIQATAMAGTSAGQTVQALSLLNHQTPEGQAIWLQRSVDKMNNDLRKSRGTKAEQFNLTEDMVNKIVNSKNKEELQNNLNDVYKELGQQVSKTNLQKIDAWRYFAMLANPKTHIRNIVGNTAMAGVQSIKNKVAGAIEGTVSKVNPNMERNHTIVSASKEVTTFAKNDIKNVADRLGLNENKYNPKTRLENSMRTFKSDTLENTIGKLFDLNDNLLEAEDGWGLKAGYTKALSEYMTANNLNPNTITDKQLAKARNYAVEQAQEATFHQASAIASALNQFQNKNGLTKFIMDSTLPFKKTPINVAKAGLEYSPAGLAKSLIYDTVNLRKRNITVNKYIDNISKGLTGTGIALLGYALADAGILKASGSDDEDKEKYDEEMGKQTYSITIAGNTYSLDWLAPTGIPLFIGAECHEIMQTDKEEKTTSSDENSTYNQAIKSATNILDSFTNAMNPMTEMSMLSGVTSALKSYDQGSSQILASLGTNAVKSYVNQFVPTAVGQIARTTDEYERNTTSTKTGVLPKAIDTTKNQIMNKIPGLRQMLPIKTDIWGNQVKQSDNVIQRGLENSVFPWTRREVSTSKVDNELTRLYDETGESSILPDTLSKKLTINGQDYRLTNEEYNKYKTSYGKTSYNLLNDLVSSSEYKNMSSSQKQTSIESIYDYAKEKNKIDYANNVNETIETSTNYNILEELKKSGGSQTQYLNYLSKTKEIQGEKANQKKNQLLLNADYSSKTKSIIYQNTTGKEDSLYNILSNGKIDINEYLDYKIRDSKDEFASDKDSDGKAISGSAKNKIYDYVNNNITGTGNKLIILGSKYKLTDTERKELAEYINTTFSNKDEKIEIFKKLDKNYTVKDRKVYYK